MIFFTWSLRKSKGKSFENFQKKKSYGISCLSEKDTSRKTKKFQRNFSFQLLLSPNVWATYPKCPIS